MVTIILVSEKLYYLHNQIIKHNMSQRPDITNQKLVKLKHVRKQQFQLIYLNTFFKMLTFFSCYFDGNQRAVMYIYKRCDVITNKEKKKMEPDTRTYDIGVFILISCTHILLYDYNTNP